VETAGPECGRFEQFAHSRLVKSLKVRAFVY
jgi:hypothetical protein